MRLGAAVLAAFARLLVVVALIVVALALLAEPGAPTEHLLALLGLSLAVWLLTRG